MQEEWLVLHEFPDYAVSNQGRIMSVRTELIKTPSLNQQGIPSVLLVEGKLQFRRAVALLVAEAWVHKEQRHFNTPINLNGDRRDNHPDNLVWRPRWFAIKYHQQFRPGYMPAINEPIREVISRREFKNSLEASVTYGILDTEIFLAVANRTVVFPTNQEFELVSW
jgi:hypothetical protein